MSLSSVKNQNVPKPPVDYLCSVLHFLETGIETASHALHTTVLFSVGQQIGLYHSRVYGVTRDASR